MKSLYLSNLGYYLVAFFFLKESSRFFTSCISSVYGRKREVPHRCHPLICGNFERATLVHALICVCSYIKIMFSFVSASFVFVLARGIVRLLLFVLRCVTPSDGWFVICAPSLCFIRVSRFFASLDTCTSNQSLRYNVSLRCTVRVFPSERPCTVATRRIPFFSVLLPSARAGWWLS